MTGPGRPPDVSGLTAGELDRTRRELAAALALLRPGSPAQIPIRAHLDAVNNELADRADRPARPATQSAARAHPWPPPAPPVPET